MGKLWVHILLDSPSHFFLAMCPLLTSFMFLVSYYGCSRGLEHSDGPSSQAAYICPAETGNEQRKEYVK